MRTCSPEGYDFGIDRYINKIIIPNSVLQRVVKPVEEKKKQPPTNQKQTNKTQYCGLGNTASVF